MGRPSVKEKRTEEILDAFEICVSKYGVEGSTLEKIAEAAGLRRSLLRHYIGNKEELLDALAERFLSASEARTQQMVSDLAGASANDLIEYLFYDDRTEHQFILVAQALFIAAPTHPELGGQLIEWSNDFNRVVADILGQQFSTATEQDCITVAVGIVSIYANIASMAPLGNIQAVRQTAKGAAIRLMNTLR